MKADGDLVSVSDLKSLFREPYEQYNAGVHSNSWGDGLEEGLWSDKLNRKIKIQRPYGDAAAQIDAFVRTSPDAFICFSAGNNNGIMNKSVPIEKHNPSVGSQAAAKNCLTVGASGSTRTSEPSDKVSRLALDAIFGKSSRGPTVERRTKPDVVAPGFNIFSARSRHPSMTYSGAVAKSATYPNVLWQIRDGTSHATPLVAGCAAILRQILEKQGYRKPPAALIKALIINGAERLPGIDVSAQGFGHVNLQASATMLEWPLVVMEDISPVPAQSASGGTLIGRPLKQSQVLMFSLSIPQDTAMGNSRSHSSTTIYREERFRTISISPSRTTRLVRSTTEIRNPKTIYWFRIMWNKWY